MIEVEFTIDLSPRQTWHVLTDALHMEKWWGDNVLLEAVPGGKFSEDWTDDDGTPRHSEGHITALEPEKRLQLSWKDDGWPHATRVELLLSSTEGGTRIYLQHSGWEKFEDEADRRSVVDSYRDGWNALMKKFQEYAATLT